MACARKKRSAAASALRRSGSGSSLAGTSTLRKRRRGDPHEGRLHPLHQLRAPAELPELLALRRGPRLEVDRALADEDERRGPEGRGRGEERAVVHLQLEVLEPQREAVRPEAGAVEGEVDEALDAGPTASGRRSPSRRASSAASNAHCSTRARGSLIEDDLGHGPQLRGGRRDGRRALKQPTWLAGAATLAGAKAALLVPGFRRRRSPRARGSAPTSWPRQAASRASRRATGVRGGRRRARRARRAAGRTRTGGERAADAVLTPAPSGIAVAWKSRGSRTEKTLPWPGRLRDVDGAVVEPHDLPHQVEPDAGAPDAPRRGRRPPCRTSRRSWGGARAAMPIPESSTSRRRSSSSVARPRTTTRLPLRAVLDARCPRACAPPAGAGRRRPAAPAAPSGKSRSRTIPFFGRDGAQRLQRARWPDLAQVEALDLERLLRRRPARRGSPRSACRPGRSRGRSSRPRRASRRGAPRSSGTPASSRYSA